MTADSRQTRAPAAADAAPSVLRSVAGLLGRPVTTDTLLQAMIAQITRELDAERGTLYLVDARTGELVSRVAQLPEIREIRLPPGQGVAGHVALTGEPALLHDAQADPHFFPGIDRVTGFCTRSMVVVPVLDAAGKVRGVLQLLDRRQGRFTLAHQRRVVELARQVAEALAQTSLRPTGDRQRGVLVDGPFNGIVGESPVMGQLYARVLAAASTDATVLLRGASGTGKSLFARAIHDNGARRARPLVHVDCTALPSGLIESELFGHERGAFTGAERRVVGKFEQAQGGTLFLDEIGELPLPLQGKLLRFLQERRCERLGGRETLHLDVRVIAATNVSLEELVAAGSFRRDLYYRVRVVELVLPSLAERGSTDIRRLAEHFLDHYARRHRRPVEAFTPAALDRLSRYSWPGNVRELEHCVESAVVLATGPTLGEELLALPGPADPAAVLPGYPAGAPLREVIREHVRRTVEACDGNHSEAARRLGIGRNTLARHLRG